MSAAKTQRPEANYVPVFVNKLNNLGHSFDYAFSISKSVRLVQMELGGRPPPPRRSMLVKKLLIFKKNVFQAHSDTFCNYLVVVFHSLKAF